jgi:hypothetical protein
MATTSDITLCSFTAYTGVFQMEQAVTTGLGILPKILSAAPQVIGAVSKVFGDGTYKDTPSMVDNLSGNFGVVDLPLKTTFLALSANDQVEDQSSVINSNGASECEHLLYRCKIPSRHTIASWTTAQSTGTMLGPSTGFWVTPADCSRALTAGVATVDTTMLAYAQNVFFFWRGGIRFTIECLPSHFHQGQLFIAFNPTLDLLSLDQARNCTSATIDLGVTNRTSMDIPFVARADYLNTSAKPGKDSFTLDECVGRLFIFVQNPLVNNGTVANSIDVNVYISALDDFELKVPKGFRDNIPSASNTQFNYQGTFQMDSEVVRDSAVAVPIHQPQQGLEDTTLDNVVRTANVVSADTKNIMQREYLLVHGVQFATSNNVQDNLQTTLLPGDFWNPSLAPTGLYSYHEFFRMGFKVTLRINPTQFHQGALMLVWLPELYTTTGKSFASYTQYPHAIMNVATETSMELEIPYSSVYRMLRQGINMGVVRVYVWNVLRAPTAAAQSLGFSLWLQSLNPHVSVKRALQPALESRPVLQGVFQGERVASDTASETSTQQIAFEKAGAGKTGYIKEDHMNVLSLLRRPVHVTTFDLSTASSVAADINVYDVFWAAPAFCGRTHVYLACSYAFCSGGNRLMISTNLARALNATAFTMVNYDNDIQAAISVAPITSGFTPLSNLYKGGSQWSFAKEQEKTIEIPHYRRAPMSLLGSPNASMNEASPVYFPDAFIGWSIQGTGTAMATDIWGLIGLRAYLYHSVSDDFHLYFPIAVPVVRYNEPGPLDTSHVLSETEMLNDFASLTTVGDTTLPLSERVRTRAEINAELTRAGVESNPGPELAARHLVRASRHFRHMRGELQGLTDMGQNLGMAAADRVVKAAQPALDSFQESCEAFKNLANVANDKVHNLEKIVAEKAVPFAQNGMARVYDMIATVRDVIHSVLSLGCNRVVQVLGVWKLIDLFVKHVGDSALVQQLKKLAQRVGVFQEDNNPNSWLEFVAENCVQLSGTVIMTILGIFGYRTSATSKSMFTYALRERSYKKDTLGKACLFVTSVFDYIFEGSGMLRSFVEATEPEQIQFTNMFMDTRKEEKWSKIDEIGELVLRARRFKKMSAAGFRLPIDLMRNVEEVLNQNAKLCAEGRVPKRMTPVCWFLFGDSGQGKSYLQKTIIPALFLKEIGKLDCMHKCEDHTYAIPASDVKHWEGYNGQYVANIDDAFTEQGPTDPLKIINLITPVDYTVPKAGIEGKKDKFVSIAVGVSSNFRNFSSITGINNHQAIARRLCDNAVTVKKNTGGLMDDLSSVDTVEGLYDYVDKHWSLTSFTWSGGKVVDGQRIMIRTYIQQIVANYRKLEAERDILLEQFKVIDFEREKRQMQGSEYLDCEAFERLGEFTQTPDDLERVMEAIRHDHVEGVLECNREYLQGLLDDIDIDPMYGFTLDQALEMGSIGAIKGAMKPIDMTIPVWQGVLKWLGVLGLVGTGIGLVILAWRSMRDYVLGSFQGSLYDAKAVVKKEVTHKGLFQDMGVNNKIRKCMRWVELYELDDPSMGQNGMHALVIEGRYLLVPHHLYEKFVQYNKTKRTFGARICLDGKRMHPFSMDATNSVQVNSSTGKLDLRVVYLHGAPMAGTPNIIPLMPTLKYLNGMNGKEYACDILSTPISTKDRADVPVRVQTREYTSFYDRELIICELANTDVDTFPGDCGRPYVCRESRVQYPLVALHSARFHTGLKIGATQLVQEEIQEAINKVKRLVQFERCAIQEEEIDFQGDGYVPRGWFGDVEVLGQCEMNGHLISVHVPTKTSKVRWLQDPEWDDAWLPSAKGRVGDVFTLETNASKKYSQLPTNAIGSGTLIQCIKQYVKRLNYMDEVWTDDDAINGKGISMPVEVNTSCGYWSKYFKNGKTELLDRTTSILEPPRYKFSEKAKTFVIPELGKTFVQRYEECDRMLGEGVAPVFLWVATNKDELRKKDKVAAGKTRVFEQPPFELSLLMRKYFGPFLNQIKENAGFVTHSAIGIDKEVAWKSMWSSLRSKSELGFDVDYSNYDGSVSSVAFDFFRAVTDSVLPEETKLQRHALLYVLQYSYLVCRGIVFHTIQGNKSGSPLTDVFNSVTNTFVMYLSYLYGRSMSGLPCDFANFDRDVRMITYGDDVIASVHRSAVHYFNRVIVARTAQALGMCVTSASKTGGLIEVEKLNELSFIKLNFRFEGDAVMCPLPLDVIWRVVQWTEKNNVGDGTTLGSIAGVAVRMMAHHGRERVEAFLDQLRKNDMRVEFDYEDFYVDMLALQEGFEFPVVE